MIQVRMLANTRHSLKFHPAGIGEISNARVVEGLLAESPYPVDGPYDPYKLMGARQRDQLKKIKPGRRTRLGRRLLRRTRPPTEPWVQLLLVYPYILSALTDLGLPERGPTITRIYAHDDFSWIDPHLHMHSTLCITQNLVAGELALQQGIRPDQLLYFPYQELVPPLPPEEKQARKRAYLRRIAPHVNPNSLLVGCGMRLRAGKNADFLLDAFEEIRHQVPEAVLVIKGELDDEADYYDCAHYTAELEQKLQAPWVIWDRSHTPHDEYLQILQSFDIGVHPTGTDDPPNTICEQLAMGTPMLLLSGGPRDHLFGDSALMVRHQGHHRLRKCWSPFYIPDRRHMAEQLLRLIQDPSLREELSRRAPPLAQSRFGKELSLRKLPLLIEGAYHLHHNTPEAPRFRQQILDEWATDYALFNRPLPECMSR